MPSTQEEFFQEAIKQTVEGLREGLQAIEESMTAHAGEVQKPSEESKADTVGLANLHTATVAAINVLDSDLTIEEMYVELQSGCYAHKKHVVAYEHGKVLDPDVDMGYHYAFVQIFASVLDVMDFMMEDERYFDTALTEQDRSSLDFLCSPLENDDEDEHASDLLHRFLYSMVSVYFRLRATGATEEWCLAKCIWIVQKYPDVRSQGNLFQSHRNEMQDFLNVNGPLDKKSPLNGTPDTKRKMQA